MRLIERLAPLFIVHTAQQLDEALAAAQDLDRLCALPPPTGPYQSLFSPISSQARTLARSLLAALLEAGLPPGEISRQVDGGLSMEWDFNWRLVSIELDETGAIFCGTMTFSEDEEADPIIEEADGVSIAECVVAVAEGHAEWE